MPWKYANMENNSKHKSKCHTLPQALNMKMDTLYDHHSVQKEHREPCRDQWQENKNLNSHHCIQKEYQESSRGKFQVYWKNKRAELLHQQTANKAENETRHRTKQGKTKQTRKGKLPQHLPKEQLKEWAIWIQLAEFVRVELKPENELQKTPPQNSLLSQKSKSMDKQNINKITRLNFEFQINLSNKC